MDHGPGAVTPTNIVADPTAPGGKSADLIVDSTTTGSLRSTLFDVLDLGERAGHAALFVNPTAATAVGQCAIGDGRVCLRPFRNDDAAGNPLPEQQQINLLPGLVAIDFDSNRVEFIPGQGGTGMQPLLTLGLQDVGIDVTADLAQLALLVQDTDAEVRVAFHPEQLSIQSRRGRMGLWMPVTISGRDVYSSSHECFAESGGTSAGGSLPDCPEIMEGLHARLSEVVTSPSCDKLTFSINFRRIHAWLGLIPRRLPGCDPLAFRSDLDWTPNVPNGRRYRQGCLDVDLDVDAFAQVNAFHTGGGDIAIGANIHDCSFSVQAYCAVSDCAELASGFAATEFERRLPDEISDALRSELRPFFEYAGGNNSPYNSATGTFCNVAAPGCAAAIQNDHLPASLTRLAYGWYANAFGDPASDPPYEFPVVDVTPAACPAPYQPASPPGSPDICVYCFPESTCAPNLKGTACVNVSGSGSTCFFGGTIPHPADVTFTYAPDPDGDGKIGAADNCQLDANVNQVDQDGDGLGDACDDCPCDPSPDPDPDGDGICTVACGGKGDNCPNVNSANQANCNADAEEARDAEILGDVCDPVPCPNFTPMYFSQGVSAPQSPIQIQVTALDELSIAPVGSFDRNATTPTEVPVEVPATHHRYCVQNPVEVGRSCFDNKVSVDDLLLASSPTYDTEQSGDVWHRVAVHDPEVVVLNVVPGTPEDPRGYDSKLPSFHRRWQWWKDFERWSTTWGVGWVPNLATMWNGQPVFPALPLGLKTEGRFWLHADTEVGMSAPISTGQHFLLSPPAMPASGLANHYEPVQPLSSKVGHYLVDSMVPWIASYCPTCPEDLGIPTTDNCPQCTFEANPDLPIQLSRMIAVGSDGVPGVVSGAGLIIGLRAALTPALEQSLGSGLTWVNQSEPAAWFGWGGSAPLAVGITPDGGAIGEEVFSANGQLLAAVDVGRRRVDEAPSLLASAQGSGRWDYVSVYSRSKARVWLLGGHDGAGAAIDEVWTRSLHGDRWEVVPRGGWDAGKVLAATYSHIDRTLWILDEHAGGAGKPGVRRLVRLDPETGRGDVLASWPRLNLFQKFWLRIDRSGSLLLFISSSIVKQHAILELRASETELEITGARIGSGQLVHPPAVDMVGYWLVTQRPKDKQPKVQRFDSLELTQPKWLNMAKWM